jgi:hypothetical protein
MVPRTLLLRLPQRTSAPLRSFSAPLFSAAHAAATSPSFAAASSLSSLLLPKKLNACRPTDATTLRIGRRGSHGLQMRH